MPLPPALAARLAKRGLLKEAVPEKPPEPVTADDAEEIIAEDYDEDHTHNDVDGDDSKRDDQSEALIFETVACPNKTNRYHECVDYCKERWGLKLFRHDSAFDKKHARLLRLYPLPDEIVEVGDPETGRYYYWNTETDEVSWLPPQHPRAKFSLPAEKLRSSESTKKEDVPGPSAKPHDLKRKKRRHSVGESESEGSDVESSEDQKADKGVEQLEKEVLRRKQQSEADRGVTKKKKDVNLDPMDPAAYSDIPKGKWSAGLEVKGSGTLGADVTASGPIFQQRPYPNPGAVLRMNKD